MVIVGPVLHCFYENLEKLVPQFAELALLKRLLIDRLAFGPVFLAITLYTLNVLHVSISRKQLFVIISYKRLEEDAPLVLKSKFSCR